MKSISSLELSYLVKELEFLKNARVDKIFSPRKKEIVLQLFVSGKGKNSLRINERSAYLTDFKSDSAQPSDFCMYLRKKIGNARLRKIEQMGFERILNIEFETKEEKFNLIIELFSKGNILLLKDKNILVAAEYQNWKDRVIRPGVEYNYPKRDHNFFDLQREEFRAIIADTNKENIVKCLAIELGLGGVYAEEVCLLSKVDKNKKSQDLTGDEFNSLIDSFEKIKNKKIDSRIIFKGSDIIDLVPFELEYYSKNKQEKAESYSKILSDYFSKEELIKIKERSNKDIDKINDIVKSQRKDIKRLGKDEIENKEKGEKIYEQYQVVDSLIKELQKISKEHPWKEIKKKLKGHKMIKEVYPKEKSVIVDLE